MDCSDDDLVLRARRGNAKAFTALYEKHRARMRGAAYSMCRDDTDAEDICQMAWARAWKKIRKFRNDSSFSTWMTVIVRRVFIDMRRKKKREDLESLEFLQENGTHLDPTHKVVDPAFLPDKVMQNEDTAHFVRSMVGLMKEPHRTVMQLFFFEGLQHDEIARVMGIPLGTSLSRLGYGKKMLKVIIERKLNGELRTALSS